MIDLSADLGEGSPDEDRIWPLITSANVACGGHTGDEHSMREAARLARRHSVRFGAHPSYPDRPNFGRKALDLAADVLRATLIHQISALHAIEPVHHVKPHGALYNDAHKNRALADVIVSAIQAIHPAPAIVAPDHSQMAIAARAAGIRVIREAFADRRYEPDGSLTPRGIPGSILTVEEAAAQAALLIAEGVVLTRNGSRIAIAFDTICVHADVPYAIDRLCAICARLMSLDA